MVPMLAEPHTLLWDYGLSAQLVRTRSTTLKMTPGSVSVPPVSIRVQGLCKEPNTGPGKHPLRGSDAPEEASPQREGFAFTAWITDSPRVS